VRYHGHLFQIRRTGHNMIDGSSASIQGLDPEADLVDLFIQSESAATPETETPALTGLPAPLTSFVGREREIETVKQMLQRATVREVTLTGPGGIGKTRLALQVAERVAQDFPDGVYFVPLVTALSAEDVPLAVLRVLGHPDADPEPPASRLEAAIGERTMLLVLDNFEQLARNVQGSRLSELLQACPHLRILITSRVHLRMSGEHVLPVPPLDIPATSASDVSLEVVPDAIKLFVSRLQAVQPAFSLTAENAPLIAAICQQVDGLPLAIELAAARGAVLSLPELHDRLQRRLPLLSGGNRDQPERLRTMHSAIAWSYDLLDPPTQAFMRRLAVFSGGISVAAAEATATAGDTGATFDALGELVMNSLLQRSDAADGSRLFMLETVREFALERLEASGEADAARRAHARYFSRFTEEVDPLLWSSASKTLMNTIALEHDNLRTAMEWSLTHEPALALGMAQRLGAFWQKRALWNEGREWLRRVLAATPAEPSTDRANALGRAGALAGDQGDFGEAVKLMTEALEMADVLGDAMIKARAYRGLAIVASHQSNFDHANELFTLALEHFRATNDEAGISRSLNDLGLVAERQGDHERAIALQEESLPIARRVGDDWQVCIVLGNLGGAYYDAGNYERGAALSREALQLSRELDDTFGVAVNLYNLGQFQVELGRTPEAVAYYTESLALIESIGEHHLLSRALDRLGYALHLLGDSRSGARLHGAATALREEIGDSLYEGEEIDLAERYARVEGALGNSAFEAEVALGRTLPSAEAIVEARRMAVGALDAYRASPAQALAGLTRREADVLRLMADGQTDQEIADALFISKRTASSHVAAIIGKLGVESRTAAVAMAIRTGIA
jgi:predicted ATPase/DNA-binding CsgD family transcriptional regulator